MAALWQILSLENRDKLAEFYEREFGKPFLPPGREDERRVRIKGKLETLEEIDRLMRKPGKGAWHG